MKSFVCATCGKTHDALPTDFGWNLPDDVWAIPAAVRSERAKCHTDLCQFGSRFFIRCVLELPFTEQPGYYGWGLWVELEVSDFFRYVELYEQDASGEPPVSGKIANSIPGYAETSGLPVLVQFRSSEDRPAVSVPAASGHRLAAEQTQGISGERYHELLVATGSLSGT